MRQVTSLITLGAATPIPFLTPVQSTQALDQGEDHSKTDKCGSRASALGLGSLCADLRLRILFAVCTDAAILGFSPAKPAPIIEPQPNLPSPSPQSPEPLARSESSTPKKRKGKKGKKKKKKDDGGESTEVDEEETGDEE